MTDEPMNPNPMTPDDVAKRALELAARAEELARHAHETAGIDEQLAQLEAELAALDAEEAALRGDDARASFEHLESRHASSDWADALTARVGSLGDRIGELVEQVTDAAMHRVESRLATDVGDEVEEHSMTVDDVREVRINSYGGAVHVTAHAEDVVAVTARGRKISDQSPLVDVELAGDVVTVATRNPRRWRDHGVRLDVRVPNGSALTVVTGGGGVRVSDVHGATSLRTGGGSVHLRGGRQRTEVSTGGGSIELTDFDGTVTAKTGGGSISVDGRLSGASHLRTGGGNISVRVAEGTNIRVDGKGTGSSTDIDSLQTERGRITGQIGDGSDGELEARTGAGTIRITR